MTERLSIKYGDQEIQVSVVRKVRTTLEIAVEPDTSVIVTAPKSASFDIISAKIHKRAAWIRRQQQYFLQYMPRTPSRQFVSGETFRYLGRQYRLKINQHFQPSVKLLHGFLVVQTHTPNNSDLTRQLVFDWYHSRALEIFHERLEICLRQFGGDERYRPKGLIIRRLQTRWGSMSPSGRLLLNTRLIEASASSIDYVITHELCHLRVGNHGPRFFRFLDRLMPDWRKRKDRLEKMMA